MDGLTNFDSPVQIQHNAAVPKLDIIDHIRQFANMELMIKYGQLLVNFQENSPQVKILHVEACHSLTGSISLFYCHFLRGLGIYAA